LDCDDWNLLGSVLVKLIGCSKVLWLTDFSLNLAFHLRSPYITTQGCV